MNESQELPATRCLTRCPQCHFDLEFPLFLASFCNFATFYGVSSGTFYRLDESFVHYGVCTREAALAPAAGRENGAEKLIELPIQIFCPHCKHVVHGRPFAELQQIGETYILAVQLPLPAAT